MSYKGDVTQFCLTKYKQPIFTGSTELIQPTNNNDEKKWREEILKQLNITTILNVSSDHPAKKHQKEWYKKLKISYKQIPINDYIDADKGYYEKFLNDCINYYYSLKKEKQRILIHCTAGINRSNSVACAILWSKLLYSSRQFPNPQSLIEWMYKKQLQDRKLDLFLYNECLRNQLIKWCTKNQCLRRTIKQL